MVTINYDILMDTELQRDALDHIMRVARGSVSQTRRDRWIEIRAQYALEAREFKMEDMPQFPKMDNRINNLQYVLRECVNVIQETGSSQAWKDRADAAIKRAKEILGVPD